jgi:mannosyltransferase
VAPQSGIFQRRVQLKGGSSVSVPLGVILLFPFLVVVLILLLFAKSPDSDNVKTMPGAGTPPSIRYVSPRASQRDHTDISSGR